MKPDSTDARVFSTLRRFVRPKAIVERCDLCGVVLPAVHQHLLDLPNRKVACGCDPCVILFSDTSSLRYRRIPRDVELLKDFHLTDAQWDRLLIPINVAFFFRNSTTGHMSVMYPSPAGATESLLPPEAWEEVVRDSPPLQKMLPDVEALLVNRLGETRDHYRVPIDECFKLVGILRTGWHGLSGGPEVWERVREFFAHLKQRAED